MPPRKKAVSETLSIDATETVAAPKKGRKSVKTEVVATIKRTPARKKVKAESDEEDHEEETLPEPKQAGKRKIKSEEDNEETDKKAPKKRKTKTEDGDEGETDKKVPKKRKTKEEKEAEAMPLAPRTTVELLKKTMWIGAHVSGAGGVQNSIANCLHIGGNSFALFLKSQRKWTSPALTETARDEFKAFCEENKYDPAKMILPHGSYLVNLAQAEAEKADQAYNCFLDDLQRCEALGIRLYNFHPGSSGPHPRPEAIKRIADQLNKAHKATSTVVTVLENMAGSGNVIGSTWEDLRDIIQLVDDKSRVGVCIDTCHSFAAGYDLRTPETFTKTIESFGEIVGMQYLKALHLNDSKAPFDSNRDVHANIGTGFLGLRAFHSVVNCDHFQRLPMVLETPIDRKGPDGKTIEDKQVWATEIKLLESMIGMDPESDSFKEISERLQDQGAEERKKFQTQADKKKGEADKKQQRTINSMFKKTNKKVTKKVEDDVGDSDGSEGACSH